MNAWVKVNSVWLASNKYHVWKIWIEDTYGTMHSFTITDSSAYCDQEHPTVLLKVIGTVGVTKWKVETPPTHNGVTQVIVSDSQIERLYIGGKAHVIYADGSVVLA